MKLTEHLPRQPTWLLVSRMLREQSRDMLEHLAMCLRLRDRARLAAEDLAVPDSAWARTAVELVAKVSPTFLLNHGVRCYAFGAALCVFNPYLSIAVIALIQINYALALPLTPRR